MKSQIAILGSIAAASLALAALGQVQVLPAPPMPVGRPAAAAAAAPPPPAIPAEQLKGKLVTVNMRDLPIRNAIQQLGEAGGMQFTLGYREGGNTQQEKRISLEARDKPLWETLLALLKQAELDSPLSVTVGVPGSGNYSVSGRACVTGPFLVVARTISHETVLQPGAVPIGPAVRGPGVLQSPVRLELGVAVDPSLRLSRVNSQCYPARATDDKGNSLVPPGGAPATPGGYFGSGGNFTIYNVSVMLQYPPADVQAGQKIAVVDGTIQANVNESQSMEVLKGNVFEKQLGTGGGIKLTVQWGAPADIAAAPGFPQALGPRMAAAGDTPFAAMVRVEADPNLISPTELNGWAPGAIQVKLLDAAGNTLRSSGASSSSSQNARQMVYRFMPSQQPDGRGGMITPGEPVKAIIEIPISIKSVEIPYHFENIPLP